MSDGSNSNCGEPGRSFNAFCEGYLLGLNENQANCQQNTDTGAGQAFGASGGFPTDSPDILDGGFSANLEYALDGDFFANQPEDPMVALPDRLVSAHAQHALDGDLFYQQPEGAQGDDWWFRPSATGELSLTPAGPHQDPLLPAQGRIVLTTASGFVGMNSCIQDLIFPEQPDESCDLALSEAGDENTSQEQGNWGQGDAASLQMLQQAYLASQPQPPTPSPEEEHPMPCGREECHICQVFSLPF